MRAIVTGSASGIGRAAARRLAETTLARGVTPRLLIADIAIDRLDATAAELAALGAEVHRTAGDLADSAVPDAIIAQARAQLGGLDVLVSNAGNFTSAPLAETSTEDFDRGFAINTRACFLLARAAYPLLRESRGTVIATSSLAGISPQPPYGSYSASKAALIMLIRQMAQEWGPDGIRANCVCPGATRTGRTEGFYQQPGVEAQRAARIPLRRIGEAEDIANAIAFLASPDAAYISGHNLVVDGALETMLMTSFATSIVS